MTKDKLVGRDDSSRYTRHSDIYILVLLQIISNGLPAQTPIGSR